ncbi:hypothetical protein CI238_07425 [Colletotrichum incanum]|uniref:DUF7136 domain-containing protein n=1 Tax=Colletotrichum incanum TaxID=1573173 RepID=A0A166L8R9_COLIC|nr:hypothetical protein CI238_07425 [Colletotrichum incanum]
MRPVLTLPAYLGAIANAAAGVLDIDLVFPRENETSSEWGIIDDTHKVLSSVDFEENGSEPYFLWAYRKVDGEGPVRLIWQPSWYECDETSDGVKFARNSSANFLVDFEVKRGGRKADLIAATANDEECPGRGHAIEVTGKTREVPVLPGSGRKEAGTCAVLAVSSSTPIAIPCRVRIDKAVVESMEAADLEERCKGLNPPTECPEKDHAAQKLAVAGAASFAAALGAGVFLLA